MRDLFCDLSMSVMRTMSTVSQSRAQIRNLCLVILTMLRDTFGDTTRCERSSTLGSACIPT